MANSRQADKNRVAYAGTPLYPHIKVKLVGNDGNAFSILARVRQALRRNKVDADRIQAFINDATSADYNHLLRTCNKYITIY